MAQLVNQADFRYCWSICHVSWWHLIRLKLTYKSHVGRANERDVLIIYSLILQVTDGLRDWRQVFLKQSVHLIWHCTIKI